MRREFFDAMEFLVRAASKAPDDNPQHVHVDRFFPVDRWTNEDILDLMLAVKSAEAPGRRLVVAIERVRLPRHSRIPDSFRAVADIWRAAHEDPPAVYAMPCREFVPSYAVLLPTASAQFGEKCGPVQVYLWPRFEDEDGYCWEILLMIGEP